MNAELPVDGGDFGLNRGGAAVSVSKVIAATNAAHDVPITDIACGLRDHSVNTWCGAGCRAGGR
jgi:hypothetical protein